MNELGRLEAVDRADFEHTLHEALDAPDIHEALRQPSAQVTAEQLRARALAAADTIATEAATEYAALLRLRTAPAPAPTGRPRQPATATATATAGNGLLAALAVLTPLLSAAAAAIFLLLGYGIQLTGTQQPLAIALIRTGWITGAIAVLAAAAASTALVITTARHRATPRHPQPDAATLTQAHAAWRQALLERGLLPFLRHQLHQPRTAAPPPRPASSPAQRTRPGYSSPDFTGPTLPSRD